MYDVIELILGTLALVLCGAAFALGAQVLRQAWRAGFAAPTERPLQGPAEDRATHPPHPPRNLTHTKRDST